MLRVSDGVSETRQLHLNCAVLRRLQLVKLEAEVSVTDVLPPRRAVPAAAAAGRCYDSRDVVTTYGRMLPAKSWRCFILPACG